MTCRLLQSHKAPGAVGRLGRELQFISGLYHGVLVIEAAFKSGAMLTVNWALEQDRDVFAVPGSTLSEKSKGTNWLIQQGGNLTTVAEDILEELNIESSPKIVESLPEGSTKNRSGFGENALDNLPHANNVLSIEVLSIERRVADLLENSDGPMHVDDITRALDETAAEVSSILVMLELRGLARQVCSMQFIADRERPVV